MRGVTLLLLLGLTGCGSGDPCSGNSNTCIYLRLEGDGAIAGVDQLELRVLGAAVYSGKGAALGAPVPLPVTTSVAVPNDRSGELTIAVNAFAKGQLAGEGARTVSVRPGLRHQMVIRLSSKPPRRIFLLPPRDGAMAGQATADGACTAAAKQGGLGGTYVALLGLVGGLDPAKTVDLADGDRQIVLTDGALASTDASFFHPFHIAAIGLGARREPATADCVWTNFSGVGARLGADCGGWSLNSNGIRGNYGLTDKADVNWADHDNRTCDALCHVYCIEQ